MKKKLFALALVLVLVCGCLAGCGSKSTSSDATSSTDKGIQAIKDAGKLKVGCKADVLNYGYLNTSTNEYEGFEIDLSYEIAGKIFGCTAEEAKEKGLVEFQGVTSKTRGTLLDNGEIDMVAGTFTITDERKKSWNFSTPYIQDAVGLLTLKANGYDSIADMDGAIIGVSMGSTTKDAIEDYIKSKGLSISVSFQEFNTYPECMSALKAGQITVMSTDRSVLSSYVDADSVLLSDRFATQDYGVATKLSNKELTDSIESTVQELLANGKMTELINKWGIQ